MRILGFDISRKGKQVEPESKKGLITGGSGLQTYYTPPSPLLTAMGITSNAASLIGDPRLKLPTYMTMATVFPEISRMLKFHNDITGNPRIISDDDVFAKEANAMMSELQWQMELEFQGNRMTGIDSLMYAYKHNTMTLGGTYYSMLDKKGELALSSRQKIDRIQMHDSTRFIFNEYQPDIFRLEYARRGNIEMDKQISNAFRSLRFSSDPKYAWGVPLLYDAEQICLSAAIMEENQLSNYRMSGSSPRMTVIEMEPKDLTDAANAAILLQKEMMEAWDVKSAEILEEYRSGLQKGSQTGKGVDIAASINGKMNINTHSLADSIKPLSTFTEDFKLALSRAVVAMGGEPSLVGLPSVGDGLGNGVRAEIQLDAMQMQAKGLRSSLNPEVRHIFDTVSMRLSKRIPTYEIEWEGLSTQDAKLEAETEKMQSEASKNYADAISSMLAAGEVAMAQAYAEENGLEYGESIVGVTL